MTQPYQELREAVERATSGPWTVGPYQYVLSPSGGEVANVSDGQKYADWGDDAEAQAEANAAFIALARNRLPALIADYERMREALIWLMEEKIDYMKINLLGDPEAQHTIKLARAALKEKS